MWFSIVRKVWAARKLSHHKSSQMYQMVVEKARNQVLFEVVNVPDSPQGRFESIVLHMFLVQRRFLEIRDSGSLPQRLMDNMAEDFDNSVREMGVGDLSVGKNVKKLSRAAQMRFGIYNVQIDNNSGLREALRSVFASGAMAGQEVDIDTLTRYVGVFVRRLSECSDQALVEGEASLPIISGSDLHSNV
jgi:cytochrome b pre-mRNA-processing protein 3|tara:strand:- start:80 stop:646 length:567 start_codon:yes stop_codon:yes gene_type:complete